MPSPLFDDSEIDYLQKGIRENLIWDEPLRPEELEALNNTLIMLECHRRMNNA